jgi:putative MATE family efflux protein
MAGQIPSEEGTPLETHVRADDAAAISRLVAERGTLRPVLRLAMPVMAEQFLSMLVGLSDTTLAGWYFSNPHLAAMNLVAYVLWLLTSLFVVISIGATALVARFVGAADPQLANRAANQAALLGAALALPALAAAALLARPLVQVMQLDEEASRLVLEYLAILIPAIPAIMLQTVLSACLRGAGDTVSGLLSMVVVNTVNIALSWGLALGSGPLPTLGWRGLAVGTSLGYLCGGLLMLGFLIAGRAGLRLRWSLLRPDPNLMGRLLRIGLPGGADIFALIGCQMVFLAIINSLGVLAAAAHGVAIRVESLAYLPGAAFQVAAATLAGQYLGARDPRRAARSVVVACIACGLLMVVVGVVFYVGAEHLSRLLLDANKAEVAIVAAGLLRIVALAMPFLAVLMVVSGALRGSGDTKWPLAITLAGFLIVRLPSAYVLAHVLGWGVRGAWWAMFADLVFRSLLAVARFRNGGWRRIEV